MSKFLNTLRADLKTMVLISVKNAAKGRFYYFDWYTGCAGGLPKKSDYLNFLSGQCGTTACLLGGAICTHHFARRGLTFDLVFGGDLEGTSTNTSDRVSNILYKGHAQCADILATVFHPYRLKYFIQRLTPSRVVEFESLVNDYDLSIFLLTWLREVLDSSYLWSRLVKLHKKDTLHGARL